MKSVLQAVARYWRKLDKPLLFASLLCSILSVLLLYSIYTNHVLAEIDDDDYIVQCIAVGIGVASVLILAAIDYHKIARFWFIYAPIALILVLLTFTSLGYQRSGADDQAWLQIGSITLQPAEILKLAFILTFSLHLAKDEENMNHPFHMLLLILHGCLPMGLVVLQGDYGTAIVFAFIFAAMLMIARISWKYILAGMIAVPSILILAWNFVLGSTHKNRILVLLHPGTDPEGLEYQQDLGLTALASGKLFGVGLFDAEDYVSVPEMHNDFIFAYIGETLGFVGAMAVVLVMVFLCLRTLSNGLRANDRQGLFLCIGVSAMIFTHCFMNIGMVLKVMPVIGVPLPFLSAGGTATLSMYAAIGLVISVRTHNERKYNVFYDYKSPAISERRNHNHI
ncbi:MAG: FtsW/RodA/SpoVE family cell cycle protein [Oscillospiraceae bacterium]|nr:FtsW/RodA/SpoVE family cell cycle protein [Oscillospiraceae bacterium]